MKMVPIVLSAAVAGILIATGYSDRPEDDFHAPFYGSVDHVHGIGYIADEEGLYVAAHTGLKIHRNGIWLKTTGNANDYTGFSAVDEGFFASGHPGSNSELPDPLGLQHSTDGGKKLHNLGFSEQADFHMLAAGYKSHDIFLQNTEASILQGAGFYKSSDLGETWDKTRAENLEGEVTGLAVHPTDTSFIAASTSTGVYLSLDGGESFNILTGEGQTGTAAFFSEDHLYFAMYDGGARLIRYDLHKEDRVALNLPLTERDAAVSIAQHPEDEERFAIYSLQGHVFVTEDGTETWKQILTNNKVQ